MRILTWHVHGSYLWYLSHVPVEWYLPVRPGRPEGYGGRAGTFPWPSNVHEVDAGEVPGLEFDAVLYQSHRNWLIDRHELLDTASGRSRPSSWSTTLRCCRPPTPAIQSTIPKHCSST